MAAGSEFGSEAGKNMLVINPFYGFKSSGASFRDFLAETMDGMSNRPSYSNPDL